MTDVSGRCTVNCATIRGVRAEHVEVEVAVSSGLPGFHIVGMTDVAIQESRVRVKAAIRSSGFSMPNELVVVNLAPSALRKSGTGFDLAIAVGILIVTGQVPADTAKGKMLVGELSLEGAVRPVDGLLAYSLAARDLGLDLVCAAYGSEIVEIDDVRQVGVGMLRDVLTDSFVRIPRIDFSDKGFQVDYSDIGGNEPAKRALQIAAAGSHGILMMGPPGSGKTMLAQRLPTILPPLTKDEALESALVHSVAGLGIGELLLGRRPFRSPHHSSTGAGLVGGGTPVRPGEVSLAHNGVLMLDELAEFRSAVLQLMRQPIEDGRVLITRADGTVSFPSKFMLVGATNPCPCGYLGDPERKCTCSEAQVRSYRNRIGGPLMDRIDMHIDVRRVPADEVLNAGGGTSSSQLRDGVMACREFREWRQSRDVGHGVGVSEDLVRSCALSDVDQAFYEKSCRLGHMSGRGMIRTLSVARTIADMRESERVEKRDLCEALGFRIREAGD